MSTFKTEITIAAAIAASGSVFFLSEGSQDYEVIHANTPEAHGEFPISQATLERAVAKSSIPAEVLDEDHGDLLG